MHSSAAATSMRTTPSTPGGVVSAAISSEFNALRASPSDTLARCRMAPGSASTRSIASPRSPSHIARSISPTRSSSDSGRSSNTVERDTKGAFTKKKGLCVVAPINRTAPDSTSGSSTSCCARLNRWISSMNSNVGMPVFTSRLAAACNTRRRSATLDSTPFNRSNRQRVRAAINCANDVFPVPGGPYRINDCTRSASMARRSSNPGPST